MARQQRQTPEQPPARMSVAAAIALADESDLVELRELIDAAERELHTLTREHRQRIDALKKAASVVERKLHGKPARAARGAREASKPSSQQHETRDKIRQQIHDLLSTEGSMPVPAIAKRLSRSNIQIAMIVRHCDWFKNEDGEVTNA